MNENKPRQYSQLAEASIIGMVFPIAIALGYGWGAWMDGIFGTKPWLSYIFAGLGVVAGFVNLFRFALRSNGKTGNGSSSDRSGS
ncbi:MAG TPA: AtpZ/AtpI family protein [Thermoanaerobaculia bacterium]